MPLRVPSVSASRQLRSVLLEVRVPAPRDASLQRLYFPEIFIYGCAVVSEYRRNRLGRSNNKL